MTTATTPVTPVPSARDVLTQVEAQARAANVSDVAYTLDLSLTRSASEYRGEATIEFDLAAAGSTFLDYRGKTIEVLEVNGEAIASPEWTGYRLTLPASALRAGRNSVRVRYVNDYDHTGDGLHQFIDPEDGEEYLYTNFEPYESHRLFPNFDQPDIKARYTLSVTAPAEWELVANSAEASRETQPDGRIRHAYTPTQPFSTYLFAMIAGPYHVFRDEHRGVALGFFARRSLVKHVDTDELFGVTKQGLDFYADFFDYPYPFGKYDQIFVPEFNAGAMENVAAVTHSERLVFRDPPTDNQRLGRAEVLLHEMAHMWFGNLVTMRWWNDLWLNESFATYMAYLSLTEATRFTTAWQAFNAGMKNWAYRQDQLITTHPIAGEVPDTEATFLNFDGITYGKGAAVIQQLVAAMGMDGFRSGMRLYFKRHAFSNTTLSQFLDALSEGVGRDLHEWARAWLETPSLNTVQATWEVDGDRVSSLTLAQTAPEQYSTLRPHHLEIALVRDAGSGAPTIEALPVDLAGASVEVPEAVGRPAPQLVFPNYRDHGFVKVALDEMSLGWVRENLDRIDDPLLRQLIWQTLWNMVRDQQMKSTDYLELVGAKVPSEQDKELIETILGTATASIARYVPEEQRAASAHRFFEDAWRALQAAPQGDMQIIWARALIGSAISPEDITHTARLADGALSVPGLNIDQDMRWSIAASHVAYGLEGSAERVAAERERDPSDRGQRATLRCETAAPDAAAKAEAWRRYHEEGYGSLHLTAAAMSGFHWWVQRDILTPYVDDFFQRVRGVFRDREVEFARSYFGGLFPPRVERAILDRANELIAELEEDEARLRRQLLEACDDLERAIKCREFGEHVSSRGRRLRSSFDETVRPQGKVFYGWWLVVASAAVQLVIGVLFNQAQGAYMKVLRDDFDWSRGALSGAISLSRVESGMLGPVEGWLLDRYGPRKVMVAGLVLMGAAMMLFSFTSSLPMFYGTYFLMALGATLGGFLSITVALVNWFSRHRAKAMALAQMGFAASGFLVPITIASMERFGWQETAFASGVLIWVIGLPLAFLIRDRPDQYGEVPDGAARGGAASEAAAHGTRFAVAADGSEDFNTRQALRTRAFWFISLGHAAALLIVSAVQAHMIIHLTENLGYSLATAGLALPLLTAAQIGGQLSGGFLGDRFDKRIICTVCMAMHCVGMLSLAFASNVAMIVAFALLHGWAWGARGPLMQAIRADYFGTASFGKIMGISTMIVAIGSSAGPIVAGVLADVTGNYQAGFTVLSVLAGLGSIFFVLATKPTPPARTAVDSTADVGVAAGDTSV